MKMSELDSLTSWKVNTNSIGKMKVLIFTWIISLFRNSVHQTVQWLSPQHPNLDTPTLSKWGKDILPFFRTTSRTVNTIEDIKDKNDKMFFFYRPFSLWHIQSIIWMLKTTRADTIVLDSSVVKTETDAKKGRAKRKLKI